MIFRESKPADISRTFDIRCAAKENPIPRELLTSIGVTEQTVGVMLATTHRCWVCEIEGEVVGFVTANGSNGELWVIAVLPEHEGKGIGRKLMTLAQDWLWSKGWKEIWLVTGFDDHARATYLYTKLGWTTAGIRDNQRLMILKRPKGI